MYLLTVKLSKSKVVGLFVWFWGVPILRRGWLIYVEAGLLSRHFSSPTAAFFILTDLHWFSISATFYQRLRVDYSRYKTKIYYSKSPRAETITAENGKEISTFWGRWKILFSISIKLIHLFSSGQFMGVSFYLNTLSRSLSSVVASAGSLGGKKKRLKEVTLSPGVNFWTISAPGRFGLKRELRLTFPLPH